MAKHDRYGHTSSSRQTEVFRRRDFCRWQRKAGLADGVLCEAVQEMECGLVDANLGGLLFKKRISKVGHGKSGGYRVVLAARVGSRYVYLHGFSKSEKSDISEAERAALQFAGRVFLELSAEGLSVALNSGVLQQVNCETQDH
jgi:hypothetical protein